MSQSQRSLPTDSSNNIIRKRVGKACDRCRLKKSKCDGLHPCTRCKADNTICVFGERKRSDNKVYPKGYIEMLEQQQEQLVSALQEMYHRLGRGELWPGIKLDEVNGQPLTHDILARFGILETKQNGSKQVEELEDDFEKMQSKLLASGTSLAHRRGWNRDSTSSGSDYNQPSLENVTPQGMPAMMKLPASTPNWFFPSRSQSSGHRQRQPYPAAQLPLLQRLTPLSNNSNEPQLSQSEREEIAFVEPGAALQSNFAITTLRVDDTLDSVSLTNAHWSDHYFSTNMNCGD